MRVAIAILLLLLPSALRAAPVADAGADVTTAQNVPVLLDARASTGATAYLWSQVSGPATATILMADWDVAKVIALATAGAYVFRVTVSDGSDTATDDMTVTVANGFTTTNYVDLLLTTNILDGKYSIANRDGTGSDGNAVTNLQHAANIASAGDVWMARGGTYTNTFLSAGTELEILRITNSGTRTAPILYRNYPGEVPLLTGFGYNTNLNESDQEIGKSGNASSNKTERLVLIQDCQFIQVQGFEATLSQDDAFVIRRGRFNAITECVAHNNWTDGFSIAHTGTAQGTNEGNFVWYCESYHNRHGNGFLFAQPVGTTGQTNMWQIDNVLWRNLAWKNGFHDDDREVGPTALDPDGGGNSDAAGASKAFYDTPLGVSFVHGPNLGPRNAIVAVVGWHNSDDGFDTSWAESLMEANVAVNNGPQGRRGFKMLRTVHDMTFRGNVAYLNQGTGFEFRAATNDASADTSRLRIWNNTAVANASHGLHIATAPVAESSTNNLGANNTGTQLNAVAANNSWSSTTDGNPELNNAAPDELDLESLSETTVAERWATAFDYYLSALRPASHSPLIDAGLEIPGYAKEFNASAPDIGAFESADGAMPAVTLRVNRLRATTITIP